MESAQMRFLFSTLQHIESDFYGRVGRNLRRQGHDVAHLTYSRRAAQVLRRRGDQAYCLPDLMAEVEPLGSWREEEARIVDRYPIPSLHEVYRTDLPCRDESDEAWCVERTVRHFLAIEALFERLDPEVVVPEVGNESIRTVCPPRGHRGGSDDAVPHVHDLRPAAAPVRRHDGCADRRPGRAAGADAARRARSSTTSSPATRSATGRSATTGG